MYTLHTSSTNPFGLKASAALGYGGIPCRVRPRTIFDPDVGFESLPDVVLTPVLRKGDWSVCGSMSIVQWVANRSERALRPPEEALEAICWLLAAFADGWMGRWTAYSRWRNREDAEAAGRELGSELFCGAPAAGRLSGRALAGVVSRGLHGAGIRDANRQALRQSRDRTLQALERLLEHSSGYLFGDYPTVADFGIYGQLEQYRRDPIGGERMRMYPAISEWIDGLDRMRLPHPVVSIRHGTTFDLRDLRPLFGEFFGTYWRILVGAYRVHSNRGDRSDASVELLDGTSFECRPTGALVERLGFALEQFDRLVEVEPDLLDSGGLAISDALDVGLERLQSDQTGAALLSRHDGLARRL